jgi:hypothetical protein
MILVNGQGKISECPAGSALTGHDLALAIVFEHELADDPSGRWWNAYRQAVLETRLLSDGKIIRAVGVL